MTVEPMTDAEVDRLRLTANAKWIDRGGMWMRPIDVLDLIARLDAERTRADAAEAERDQHATAYIELHGQHVAKMIELADARSALKRAEAERDAAVARAMPEPVLVRTVEEVGALTTGAYRIAAPWQPRRKWILGWRHPTGTWTLLIGTGASGVKDDHIVGSWVQRLPDLPTPTAAQEGQGNG